MALDPINKLRQEAAAAVPTGHYRLTGTDRLRAALDRLDDVKEIGDQ